MLDYIFTNYGDMPASQAVVVGFLILIPILYLIAGVLRFVYFYLAVKLFYSASEIDKPAWKMALFAALFFKSLKDM